MPVLEIEGNFPTQLNYSDAGTGRPVVLIHGWPSSQAAWEPIRQQLLAAGYRVVTYDRRGFGASGKPEDGFDYDTFADDLEALLSELELLDCCLVGFSMGGGEVARYLGKYGTRRITSVAFVAAIPPCLDADLLDNPAGAFKLSVAEEMQAGLLANPEEFLTGFLQGFYSVPDGDATKLMVPEQVIADSIAIAKQADVKALSACIPLWLTDFRADLAGQSLPMLVVHGEGDQIVPFAASGQRVPELAPQAKVVAIPDGPHGLLASHPDVVAKALLDFLG